MQVCPHLILVALPPRMVSGRSGTGVRDHPMRAGDGVPPALRLHRPGAELVRDGEVLRRRVDPGKEWLPELLRVLPVEPLRDHRELERVAQSDRSLLAPVWVEKTAGIEVDEMREQLAKGVVRPRLDRAPRGAEMLRQLVGAQGEAGDDAPTAAAAALDGPEEIRGGAGVQGGHPPVGGDHLGLEQSRGSRSEALGAAAEGAALNE